MTGISEGNEQVRFAEENAEIISQGGEETPTVQ
jgi:hypothetical protein